MEEKQFIHDIVAEKADIIAGINRAVWDYAEFGYQEDQSAEKIKAVLRQEGFEVEEGVAKIPTAFVGRYGSGKPVIGILAEYDALPDLSQKAGCAKPCPIEGKKYGHGCGHSALGAGAAGAAIAVKEYLQRTGVTGTVELYGCPAEETGFGKAFMVKEHCFDGIDAAFSWHPMDGNMSMSVRTVAYYKVRFDFKGTTAHAGAAPELGRSALDACELMNVGVNYLREHIISDARVHYAYLDCGGEAPNIVPDHASLLYFIRAPKLVQSGEILERMRKIAEGAALMTETKVSIKVLGGLSDTIPNPTLSRLLSDAYLETGAPDFGEEEFAIARDFLAAMPQEQRERVVKNGAKQNGISEEEFAQRPLNSFIMPYTPAMRDKVMTGSSDVGDVSYQVPTAQITAATGIPETGAHTWQMTAQVGTSIGDKASQAVARAIALACAKIYGNPEILDTAKKELEEETGGVYLSPIPEGVQPGAIS